MNRIAVAALTSEAFAPFGEVGAPLADGGHAPGDVALDLSRGIPRFYIKLGLGTWHAGPYFTEPVRDFYNLEMVDTNTADYTVWRLNAPTEFAT